ncbi:MAG: FHA domain-containing protein [Planctomycetes bacterium]|nr:FHA domain-containing protein [Planctomycetota bacterium]
MTTVTFQVLDGHERGLVFDGLPTPVSVGREDGNLLRLTDERVSRFHLKVQEDHGHVVLTDLGSTNGTKVNGETVHVCLLRPGDQIRIGGTLLVFGSRQEIADRVRRLSAPAAQRDASSPAAPPRPSQMTATAVLPPSAASLDDEQAAAVTRPARDPDQEAGLPEYPVAKTLSSAAGFSLCHDGRATLDRDFAVPSLYEPWFEPPRVPAGLSPSQAAQISELLLMLHRRLRGLIDSMHVDETERMIRASLAAWQGVLALEMDLARMLRQIAEPQED